MEKVIYEWKVEGRWKSEEAIKVVFPNHLQFYLAKVKDISKLRIKLGRVNHKYDKIVFYEESNESS